MHLWNLPPSEAFALQKELPDKITCEGRPENIRYLAGYRLPEPTRIADREVGLYKKSVMFLSS